MSIWYSNNIFSHDKNKFWYLKCVYLPTINFMSDFMGALYIVMCAQNGKRFSVFIPLYSVHKRLWLPLCAFALIVWIDWIPWATEMVTITGPLAAQKYEYLKIQWIFFDVSILSNFESYLNLINVRRSVFAYVIF